jgi:hypothetical protein
VSTQNPHLTQRHLATRRQLERASRTSSQAFYGILVVLGCVAAVDVIGLLIRFGIF